MADQIFGVSCGFWDAINYDRTYSAEDMNRPYARIVADGVFATNEGEPSSDLQVAAAGTSMNITVQRGQGIFAHKWFENPTALLITVPGNTALYPRVDSVIAQVDKRTSGRAGNIVYRTGTPAQNPEEPAINATADVIEYRIANIRVEPSAGTVAQSDITDLRGSAACPWVTGLIQQVDTSTLWAQFQAAYNAQYKKYTDDFDAYTEAQRQAWEDFISSLTEELTVTTSVITLTSTHITEAAEDEIPIGIESYDPETDVLQVYINGLHAVDGDDYVLGEGNATIDLTTALEAGQTVVFVVYKSIIGGGTDSATSLIQRLDRKLDGFMADSGWIELALEGNVTAASAAKAPAVRAVGNRVYMSGSVKGVTGAQTKIASLPVSMRPGKDVTFSSAAVTSGGTVRPLTITVEAQSGDVIVSAVGNVASGDVISVSCSFLANSTSDVEMIFRYMGSVNSYAALPSEDVKPGDVYMIMTADAAHHIQAGDCVLWNGTGWELVVTSIPSWRIDQIINSIS